MLHKVRRKSKLKIFKKSIDSFLSLTYTSIIKKKDRRRFRIMVLTSWF